MTSVKYIGMDVHKEAISIALMNGAGKLLMESIIETKAGTILQFFAGLRGDLRVTFEEGTWAAWLYDLLKAHVTEIVVCNPRKNALLKDGSKSDRIDARKLADLLRGNYLKPVYHGEHGLRMLKELSRTYLAISKDLVRVMNRLKPAAGHAATVAPRGSPASAIGEPKAQCDENTESDSNHRSHPSGSVGRAHPDATSFPNEAATVGLQRLGGGDPRQCAISLPGRTTAPLPEATATPWAE